jgi:para-nitrobenzyl esterase
MTFKTAWILAVLGVMALQAGASPPAARVVDAPAGKLEGIVRGDAQAFLGIPFAQAPVGERRWKEPQPLPRWPGTRKAQAFGASCYQEWPAKPFGPFTAEFVDTPPVAEDCLFLNVWRPVKMEGPLPVMVWIHGGGFGGGSGAVEIYDGARLAARGIVVVSINYRVGPFGFMAHPELTQEAGASGNYGLQDMVAALRWVQANIRAFGGDPQHVTIAGQSAGAVAVNDLLCMEQARGLFGAAIAQSGSGMGIPTIPLREAEGNGSTFAAQLGVKTLAQLRALPPEKIQAGIPTFFGPNGMPQKRIPFRPVLDGRWLRVDPVDGAAAPQSAVPLMTGFTRDDFVMPGPRTPTEFEANMRRRYGAHADEFLRLYPHANAEEATTSDKTLARDTYLASVWLWTQRRVAQHGAPVYAYVFEHPAPPPVPAPAAGTPSWGSFHTSEVPYVFGNLDPKRRAYVKADAKVSEALQARWLGFIRSRDPNGAGLPAWRAVHAGANELMQLGDAEKPVAPVSTPERQAAFAKFVAAGGLLSVM